MLDVDVFSKFIAASPESLEEVVGSGDPFAVFEFCYDFVRRQKVDQHDMAKLIKLLDNGPLACLALYTEALYSAGGLRESWHKEWLEKAWQLFQRGEFVQGKYDPDNASGLAFHFPDAGVKNLIRYRMSIERAFAILFAFRPDEMEEDFAHIIKKASLPRAFYDTYFDTVREKAIQPLIRINHQWLLRHLPEWSARPWWPKLIDDDGFDDLSENFKENIIDKKE